MNKSKKFSGQPIIKHLLSFISNQNIYRTAELNRKPENIKELLNFVLLRRIFDLSDFERKVELASPSQFTFYPDFRTMSFNNMFYYCQS